MYLFPNSAVCGGPMEDTPETSFFFSHLCLSGKPYYQLCLHSPLQISLLLELVVGRLLSAPRLDKQSRAQSGLRGTAQSHLSRAVKSVPIKASRPITAIRILIDVSHVLQSRGCRA